MSYICTACGFTLASIDGDDATLSATHSLTHKIPFMLAHLATRATRDDASARYAAKWTLVQDLYRRGWDKQQVIDLFKVLDWMMRLPRELEAQLLQTSPQRTPGPNVFR